VSWLGVRAERLRFVAVLLVLAAFCGAKMKPAYDSKAAAAGGAHYLVHCASCHGTDARGDGPFADLPPVVPPDLTKLAQHNRGRFPFGKIERIIDGRIRVKGHGDGGMPVWGDVFRETAHGYDERLARERIRELTHYLASLQTVDPAPR
jgi:mono/diheme cytochrome c family protein